MCWKSESLWTAGGADAGASPEPERAGSGAHVLGAKPFPFQERFCGILPITVDRSRELLEAQVGQQLPVWIVSQFAHSLASSR